MNGSLLICVHKNIIVPIYELFATLWCMLVQEAFISPLVG